MKKKRRFLSVTRDTAKKGVYLFLVLLLVLHARAQVANETVSLTARRQSVVDIFKELEKQSTYKFMFHDQDLLSLGLKDIDVRNVLLTDALNRCLEGSNISYEVVGDQIVFKRNAQQQQIITRTITGTVVDMSGSPMPGATVIIEGTQIGGTTDRNGKFTLRIPATGKTVLVIRFIGHESKTIEVGNQTDLRVILEESTEGVGEVVITGYSTLNKRDVAGSVQVIDVETIMTAGESGIDAMLQGVVPGMTVVGTSGRVGAAPKIRIRGTATILGNQEPLWVVDGVIQHDPLPIPDDGEALSVESDMMTTASNAISWLNPNDIATITILKDASATAIYGSRAANGVIVITTKKASMERLSVNYSSNFTIGQKPRYHLYDMMNSQELMRYAQEMYADRDSYTTQVLPIGYAELIQRLQDKTITQDEFNRAFRKMESENTDWFDLLFRNDFSQNHNISISARGDNLSSRFSVGLSDQRGEATGNNEKRITANSNSTYRLDDRFSVDLTLGATLRETSNFAFGISPYDYAMSTSRTLPMYNEDGTFFYYPKSGRTSNSIPSKNTYDYNIQNEINETGINTTTISIQSSLNVRFKLFRNLELQAAASYSLASSENKRYATEFSHYIASIRGYEFGGVLPNSDEQKASMLPFGGLVEIQDAMNKSYSTRTSLIFNDKFNNLHNVTLQLGFELQSGRQTGNTNTRYGYLRYRGENFATIPSSFVNVSGAATSRLDLHESMRSGSRIVDTKNNTLSEYLTGVYIFDDRYVLNFSARLDASNRFGQDNNKRFNPSWSVGVKWRVGDERYMEWAKSVVDILDISASFGYRGNAVTSVSPYLIASDGGFHNLFSQYYLTIKSLPYPNLGWEKTKDWNLSFDLSFLNHRLNATIETYGSSSNALSSREVIVENGVGQALISGTLSKTRGIEFIVSATPVRTKDLTWSLSVNAGRKFNKLENNQRVNTRNDFLNGSAIFNGKAYSTFWGYSFAGLNPENGTPMFNLMDIEPTDNDLDYLVKVGKTEPDFAGGIATSFRYKNFHLRANFSLQMGFQKRLPSIYPTSGAPTPDKNAPKYLLDRWRRPGDEKITDIPSVPLPQSGLMWTTLPTLNSTLMQTMTMYDQSDIRVADADSFRCRQVSIQYDLPERFAKLIYARRISFSASMTNPFFIAFDKKWEGRDPETSDGWPARRTTSISLNLTF